VDGRATLVQVAFLEGSEARVRDAATEQVTAAPQEENDEAEGEVDEERGQEEQGRVTGKARLFHDAVGDAAEDADRREATGAGTVDDQQAHHQGVDLVTHREAHPDRGDDRHRGRDHRAEGRETGRDQEHDPRNQADAALHCPDGGLDEPVDRAVGFRDGEQVRDADEDDEQIAGETGEDGVRPVAEVFLVEHGDADDESGDDRERAEVHRPHRGYQEDECEDEDRDEFYRHQSLPYRGRGVSGMGGAGSRPAPTFGIGLGPVPAVRCLARVRNASPQITAPASRAVI
jgi:hypothetical protein